MKYFVKFNLVLIFSFLSFVLLLILFPRFNNNLIDDLKRNLADAGVYDIAFSEFSKQFDKSNENTSEEQSSEYITELIKQEVSPEYIRGKTEKFIDDTSDWMNDIKKEPPVISFQDVKTKIINQNTDLITVLEEVNQEYNAQKEEIKQQSIESGTMTAGQEMPDFDMQKLIKSDIAIPVGEKIVWIKTIYQIGVKGVYVIGIFEVVILAIIILMSDTAKSKLRWAGFTFLTAFLVNGIFLISIYFSNKGLLMLISNQDVPVFFSSIGNAISPVIVEKFLKSGGIASGVYLILFLVLVIMSQFIKRTTSPSRPQVKNAKKIDKSK